MKTDTQIREEIEGLRSLTTAQLKRSPADGLQTDPGALSEAQADHRSLGYGSETEKAKVRFGRTQPDLFLTSLAEAVEQILKLVEPSAP